MFICSFCEKNKESDTWFTHTGICDTCKKIQQLSAIYTMEELLKTLEHIYVRDEEPIKNRTQAIKNIKVVDKTTLRNGKNI